MEIDNNSNISSLVASSISKLNLNSATPAPIKQQKKQEKDLIQENLKDDVKLINNNKISKNSVDVADIQKYANLMGENLTPEEINYGLMYGRSVIADFSA